MDILTESVRANLKICYGEDMKDFTVSRLDTEADADSLMLLGQAVSLFQGAEPLDLLGTKEFKLETTY